MATTSSTIRTTINKIAQNYKEIETGKPILMGHIIYRIIERNMSLAKIAEWASNINKKNGFLSTITKNDVIRADRIYKKWRKVINQKDIEECLSNCEETLIKESPTTQGTYNSTYNSTPSDTAVTNNTDASANATACMNTKDDSKLVLKLKQKIRRLELELKYVKNKDKKRKVLRKKLLKKNKSNKRKIEIDDITSRKFHYLCKLHNLPSTTIKSLVSKIYEFFDIKAKVFSKTAYQTMTAELGFMSDFITCQSLLKSEDATIIFYATTKDGHHFNNIIFCTEKSSYVASVQRLAGGTARDYSSHIFETIEKLSKSYALVSGENIECIRQNLISKIKCCLTDRAPVNHSTIFLLENKWQKNLIELNCNVHPLEAMTKDVCKSLKSFEDTSVHNLGFHQIQCIGQSIITHFNTLRYNNNKGLIKELKNFMNENFSKSIIPRFRGNRINIIFHLSFIYFVHKDKFLEFLKSYSQIKPLCRQLESAFGNDIACLELKVLGIIGKLLSGPWMSTFYTSLKDQHSVTDGITIVKDLLDRLGMLVQDPIKVLHSTEDFFGNPINTDDVDMIKLMRPPSQRCDLFTSMMKAGLQAVIGVIQRQFKSSFERIDILREAALTSTRSHTMDAESVFGEFSVKRNSSAVINNFTISNQIKSKRNKVLDFLHDNTELGNKLIRLAIPVGRSEHQKNIKLKKEIEKEVTKRICNKKKQLDEKARRKLELELKQIDTNPTLDYNLWREKYPNFPELINIMTGCILARDIDHLWNIDDIDKIFKGTIIKFDKKFYTIVYFLENSEEEELDLSKYQLAADYLSHELFFV